jgi:transposase, IS5 family
MRKKIIAQRAIFDQSIRTLTALVKPDWQLKRIDAVIKQNPKIIDLVHQDLTGDVSANTGANGMSSEQVLRIAIVKQLKQYPWRELAQRLNDGIWLRWFCRLYTEKVGHFTALQKAVKPISEKTWDKINQTLIEFAKARKIERGRCLRTDTTVTQTNIAYPVDARLLWDAIRVLTRLMQRIIDIDGRQSFEFANRTRMARKLCYKIVMVKGRNADKKRKKLYRHLIRAANEVFDMACRCHEIGPTGCNLDLMALHEKLDHYLTLSAVAIDQCERRVLNGEKVPAEHKVVSIFEEHTDIICRGKSMSPTEFGHKVLFATGKSGLITQYQVLEGNPGDNELLPEILRRHKRQFGRTPHMLCADRRFFSAENEKAAYGQGVKRVSIVKPGYKSVERRKLEKERWFRSLQRFRAGIEGIISGLMRGLGLKRCLWKGWQSFKKYVALSVVTFNMRKIAALL